MMTQISKTGLLLLTLVFLSFYETKAQSYIGEEGEIAQILKNIENFSEYVKEANHEMIGNCYAPDAKIFPNNQEILKGKEEIITYWTFPEDIRITKHKVTPFEIRIVEDTAYDYGIYEGTSVTKGKDAETWKGKYVIVWKKVDGEWKIYLDIWNSIAGK